MSVSYTYKVGWKSYRCQYCGWVPEGQTPEVCYDEVKRHLEGHQNVTVHETVLDVITDIERENPPTRCNFCGTPGHLENCLVRRLVNASYYESLNIVDTKRGGDGYRQPQDVHEASGWIRPSLPLQPPPRLPYAYSLRINKDRTLSLVRHGLDDNNFILATSSEDLLPGQVAEFGIDGTILAVVVSGKVIMKVNV